MFSRKYALIAGALLVTAACDKAQLLAPTSSTISISASTRVLPTNGSAEVTAFVLEEAGTPVQNGTTVRFLTSMGRVDPVEVQTRNGLAITTFFAGTTSGVAEIRATSGAASGDSGSGTGTATNVLEIIIGAAAVNTVTVRANPGSVSSNGGSAELIATVVAENGRQLEGILVTFNATRGSLSSSTAVTNANGEARTTLTTSEESDISATAGAVTSALVLVTVRLAPTVTLSCSPVGSAATNCANVQASGSGSTATVLFTVTKPTGSSTLRTATLDFGDGGSIALGNLAGGSATVPHTYQGPSDASSRAYTATVHVTDISNESASASSTVIIAPSGPINVSLSATGETATSSAQRFTFTATATGGGEGTGNAQIQSYTWNFGDGSAEVVTSGNTTAHVYGSENNYTVTVTARTADGRSAVGRTEIIVNLP